MTEKKPSRTPKKTIKTTQSTPLKKKSLTLAHKKPRSKPRKNPNKKPSLREKLNLGAKQLLFIFALLGISFIFFTAKILYDDSKTNQDNQDTMGQKELSTKEKGAEALPQTLPSSNLLNLPSEPSPVSEKTVSSGGLSQNSPNSTIQPEKPKMSSPTKEPVPSKPKIPVKLSPPPEAKPKISPPKTTIDRPKPISPTKGILIFVFDDAGHNVSQLEPFLNLPFPCTIAVLPGLRYSREAAVRTRAAGKELILHQPMQAINLDVDPGPGSIQPSMDDLTIRQILMQNIAEIGPIVGINNHEGSLITADARSMAVVLELTKENGIYFLDSRTNSQTQAPFVAKQKGITIWERSVFLDNTPDREDIIEAVYNGMKIADKGKPAIMIGHIWSNNLAAILTEMYPEMVERGYSLSTIARIATEEDFLE